MLIKTISVIINDINSKYPSKLTLIMIRKLRFDQSQRIFSLRCREATYARNKFLSFRKRTLPTLPRFFLKLTPTMKSSNPSPTALNIQVAPVIPSERR